jgi:DNA-binding MarR family transcriptional regulator
MGTKIEKMLHNCLFFTANSLARQVSQMAEEEFRFTGLSTSHAFLMMLVNDSPGITQKELSEALNLAPSTVTRFVDALILKHGFVERRTKGKTARIYPTDKGQDMREQIAQCWHNFYLRYSKILGETKGAKLAREIDQANEKLKG